MSGVDKGGIVIIRFTTRWPWNPASPIIARLSGSRQFSHCMAIIDGMAYESAMLHGCRVVPVDVAMRGISAYRDMPVWVPDLAAAVAFGKAQDGKGYDYPGALGIPLMASDNWGDDSCWWCSELILMMVAAGGVMLLDLDEQHRCTPNDLYQCPYPKGELISIPKSNPLQRLFFDKGGRLMVRATILVLIIAAIAAIAVKRADNRITRPVVTAQCKDGTLSHSQTRQGTCARHGGVKQWIE